MTGFTPFDILSVPLHGTHLIEASAGTGKTFTITNLVLRLVVEEQLDISRILAVTFTEAATMELRERIRRTLNQARFIAASPESADNPLAAVVVRAARLHGRKTIEKILRKAVLSFDEAGIFTIHGFCNRILNQFAFESSLPFDLELVTDQSRFVREVADDYWRRKFGGAPKLLCALAMKRSLSPDDLVGFSGILINKPLLTMIPAAVETDPYRNLTDAFDAVRGLWQADRAGIMDILLKHEGLSRSMDAYKKEVLEENAAELDRLFSGDVDPSALAVMERYTPECLRRNLKSSKANLGIPEHPFFDYCQRYVAVENACGVYYRHDFRQYLEQELARRKRENNVQYFSDLLAGLHQALVADRQGLLAAAIRDQYRAVLIDEFQDTDPLQYEIFQKLFGSGKHCLFLIGDPKQSIFAFRSADVFSYFRAAENVPPGRKYALPRNWRSETSLTEAVNYLFGQAVNPFVLGTAIGFNPVTADPDNIGNLSPIRIDGHRAGRVRLWFVGTDDQGRPDNINKEPAREAVTDAVAGEIANLLNQSARGEALIGERPLGPADIAILITRNQDAGRIKERLTALNIPAVVSRTGSVFMTGEAVSMERLLSAIAVPTDYRRLNAVLVDDLIGCSASDLQCFGENEDRHAEYEEHLRRFTEYHELWRSGGFIRVFRRFMSDYHVRLRLLGFPDGERRLTNVLHLAELMHQAAVKNRLGMNSLSDWLSERRGAEEETPDEEQLRLERDDEAVQIVTVWKSKGLQYPVVFCPFLWDKGAAVRDGNVVFHEGHRLLLDIGTGDEAHALAAGREKLSELVRLMYVAVTRAINRCYLVYGRIGQVVRAGVTAPDYVLTGGLSGDDVRLEALQAKIKELPASALYNLVAERLGPASDFIGVEHCQRGVTEMYHRGADGEQIPLQPKRFPADRIDQEWGIASFTHLAVRGRPALQPREDGEIKQDEFSGKEPDESRQWDGSIFDFPAGAVPGLCIHSIFEQLDFSLSNPESTRKLIEAALKQYGLDRSAAAANRWNDVVYQMITDVLRAPVLPHDPAFTLGGLSGDRMITEMAFYYPIRRITADGIRRVLGKKTGSRVEINPNFAESGERLEFKPVHGYMRGFIDLVFEHAGKYYLLDWKTNHLGYAPLDYEYTRLQRCIADESYYLQYYIYAVALHRYLVHRLPGYDYDRHFGGAVYLFVRGVTPDLPGNGVYFDRPDKTTVERLDSVLG